MKMSFTRQQKTAVRYEKRSKHDQYHDIVLLCESSLTAANQLL
jgi:hypothetical protein